MILIFYVWGLQIFMKIKNLLSYSLGIIVLLGASGCAHYKGRPLMRLATPTAQNSTKSISFAYHQFNANDCKVFFDRNILAKGYQPIHIAINNNTKRHLNLFKSNISLPCTPAEDVAQTLHTNTMNRVLCYGIPGLLIWPLIIPAIVDGVGSSNANKKLDRDFARKELCDQIISPFNKINGVICVPKECF